MPRKAATTTETPTRGRPRPQDVIQRDDNVLRALHDHGPQTRVALAERLGLDIQEVYLSLYRHRMSAPPRVRKERREGDRAPVWVAV